MNMEKKVLVLIVVPLMGHFRPSLELAELLLQRDNQLSITVLQMEIPIDPEGTNAVKSLATTSTSERLRFIFLPTPEDISNWLWTNRPMFVNQMIEYVKPHVREAVKNINNLCGFIIDMVNTTMIDIADEFGVPTYLFSPSPSFFIGSLLHFQTLEDEKNYSLPDEVSNISEMIIPCFAKPVPSNVLPYLATDKCLWSTRILDMARGFRRAKAILINTFAELEHYSLNSFTKDSAYGKSPVPPIYPVGPILNTTHVVSSKTHSDLIDWLDSQSPSSVVFLCFGSLGGFHSDQLTEIANGLERSGQRFLWSFRIYSTEPGGFPKDSENYADVLPKGFLDRTSKFGKVVGWVHQLDILSHNAVGGFVSHCGWNSILESIWCGVPMATWPISGEQQMNAFQLVKVNGIAVEISLDYAQTKKNQPLVTAQEIEKGLKKLMDTENKAKEEIKELSLKSRLAKGEGGSSYVALENFINARINLSKN